jgi:CheY-like chemotaxis protein
MRAASLTRQLLTFSRQQAMFPRPLSVNEVLQGSAEMLTRVIGEHIRVNIRLADGLPAVEADPAMLGQIITNLVINARDSMPRGGVLTLGTQLAELSPEMVLANPDARAGVAVQLSVADTGCGIPPENLSRIFEPFFTTKEVGKGTGLGLAVVHGIVRQHHGCIMVESMTGKGTVFRILLPACELEAEPLRTKATQSIKLQHAPKKTILVVEDEAVVRELAKIILERAGFEILEAEDGPTAMGIWATEKNKIDILITDMVMPNGMTGRELAQRLVAERPNLPVIYASGYSQELMAPDFEETERSVFLQKPYMGDQLVSLVKRLLRK